MAHFFCPILNLQGSKESLSAIKKKISIARGVSSQLRSNIAVALILLASGAKGDFYWSIRASLPILYFFFLPSF
ncbi:hypothetical protein MUP59_08955, partial [Candidatus Bathyarchaeota archaeon]|nr:hypothetical protein [Candidatus Bathyarchaeota archaeon]